VKTNRLVKLSKQRLIVAGKYREHYIYSTPFAYNFPPEKREQNVSEHKNIKRDDNLREAKKHLSRLILANENAYGQRAKFITYTFHNNVKNVSVAMNFWRSYMKRFRRRFGNYRYTCVIEFQKRGAVHFHVIYYDMPYIENLKKEIQKTWIYGWSKVIALRSVKRLSAYISAYLTKGTFDERLLKRRAFFSSRNLIQPLLFRSESEVNKRIDDDIASGTIKEEVRRIFESETRGIIRYTLYQVK